MPVGPSTEQSMSYRNFAILALPLLLAAGAAAQESPLSDCRKIAATAERLACYDAIPLPAPVASPRAEPPKVIETGIAGRFTGWWPKEKIAMTNGQVWQVIDGSTGAVNLTDPKVTIRRDLIGGYHLEIEGANVYPRVKQILSEAELAAEATAAADQAAKAAPDSVIETGIAGPFSGWWPKDKITMTNGQVWQISDDSTGTVNLTDPKVKIRRGFFGSYRLEFEGIAKAPSVKRLQ
jgi:hypothetical protein